MEIVRLLRYGKVDCILFAIFQLMKIYFRNDCPHIHIFIKELHIDYRPSSFTYRFKINNN